MADVSAGVEYKINVDGNSFLLDSKKYQLLEYILDTGSLTEAAKSISVSYRTALNYIEKIESTLNVKIVNTTKGGKGGGGGTTLTEEGYSILKECKKSAIPGMKCHYAPDPVLSDHEHTAALPGLRSSACPSPPYPVN